MTSIPRSPTTDQELSAVDPPDARRSTDDLYGSAATVPEPGTRPRRPGWPEIGAAVIAFGVLFLVTRKVLPHIPDDHAVTEGLAAYALSALIGLGAFAAAFALRIAT